MRSSERSRGSGRSREEAHHKESGSRALADDKGKRSVSGDKRSASVNKFRK